jgi:acetyl-CoA synthetase
MNPARDSLQTDQYDTLYREFRWQVPPHFNIAEVCCARWASEPARIALYCEDEAGATCELT